MDYDVLDEKPSVGLNQNYMTRSEVEELMEDNAKAANQDGTCHIDY